MTHNPRYNCATDFASNFICNRSTTFAEVVCELIIVWSWRGVAYIAWRHFCKVKNNTSWSSSPLRLAAQVAYRSIHDVAHPVKNPSSSSVHIVVRVEARQLKWTCIHCWACYGILKHSFILIHHSNSTLPVSWCKQTLKLAHTLFYENGR